MTPKVEINAQIGIKVAFDEVGTTGNWLALINFLGGLTLIGWQTMAGWACVLGFLIWAGMFIRKFLSATPTLKQFEDAMIEKTQLVEAFREIVRHMDKWLNEQEPARLELNPDLNKMLASSSLKSFYYTFRKDFLEVRPSITQEKLSILARAARGILNEAKNYPHIKNHIDELSMYRGIIDKI